MDYARRSIKKNDRPYKTTKNVRLGPRNYRY